MICILLSHPNYRQYLTIQKGIEKPSSFNPEASQHFQKVQQIPLSTEEYVNGIRAGNRTVLSKAITLVESSLPRHQSIAQQVIEQCLPSAGNSIRIGITGVPGVGKSTFIEALGSFLTSHGHKLAVLAIDPKHASGAPRKVKPYVDSAKALVVEALRLRDVDVAVGDDLLAPGLINGFNHP